ncbi:hypothetical protein BJ973_004526 [Actinoplanes tereljensis]|uniref:Neocarzinostatin family protein n=1 Tax=Paractinoplanes tereljensis TaxID=571912 RepID=A0A919TUP6_9ACTN|nr:hypothetical protein [Actinoplanes tereljensis]GIF23913.1 hypothetical protein Ate02nite_66430 [Actinoplanes tereljensis]
MHRIVLFAVAGLIGLAPMTPPAPGAAQFSFTLHKGVVIGQGAAVDLTYTATCAATTDGAQATLAAKVAEATGPSSVASGYGSTLVTCNGRKQTVVVHVFADPTGVPFAAGGFSVAGELSRPGQDVVHSDAITLKAGTASIPRDVPGAPYAHVRSALLVAGGAAIDVQLGVKCPAGETWHALLDVRQADPATGALAAAVPDSSPAFACTGTEQAVVIRIFPQLGTGIFGTGVAVFSSFATTLSGCGTPVCPKPADWRDIEITAT